MPLRIRGLVPLLLAALLAVACDDEPAPEPAPTPSAIVTTPTPPAPAVATTSPTQAATACTNQAAIASDSANRQGSTLRADVDGDGVQDDVAIAADPGGELGCQAFLVVETTSGAYSAPVWESGTQGGLPQPSVHALVDLNNQPGDEIVVLEASGASTQFVGAFLFDDGALARISLQGGSTGSVSGPTEDLFPYGGSVGHIEAVDCAPDGTVIVSSAVPGSSEEDLERGIYEIERRSFILKGTALEPEGTERERIPIDRLERFPEFAAGPFGSC